MNVRFVKTIIIKMNYSFTNAVINIFVRIVFMNIIYNTYHNQTLWITVLLAHVVIGIFVLQKFQDIRFVVIFPILKFLHCRAMTIKMTTIKKIQLTIERFKTFSKKQYIRGYFFQKIIPKRIFLNDSLYNRPNYNHHHIKNIFSKMILGLFF